MKIKIPYWQVIAIPILCLFIGAASNQAVLIANHGKFPVMVNDVQQVEMQKASSDEMQISLDGMTPIIKPKAKPSGQFLGDDVHTVMGANSHLKILADIFNVGDGVASLGDFAISLGEWAWKFAPFVWLTLIIRKFQS